jgi:predicted nucleic acid-binding protein
MPNILIDTNLLIYAFDQNEVFRQSQAEKVLDLLHHTTQGYLSVQGLAEFFSVAIRKLHPPLSAIEAFQAVERFSQAYRILDLTPSVVLEAARGVRDHQLSYYDAQIWATARLYQIPIIFSEEFDSGSTLEGIRFINPFATDFVLEMWI